MEATILDSEVNLIEEEYCWLFLSQERPHEKWLRIQMRDKKKAKCEEKFEAHEYTAPTAECDLVNIWI